jgi:tRNA(Ile)-lysidine synthase
VPDPALSERFAAGLAAIWPEGAAPDARLGLAVSGGPDSLAMLLLAHTALPGRIEAATVDHGLRPDSAGEAAMVSALCAPLGVPHAVLKVEVADGNLQSEARSARYGALATWVAAQGLTGLATAHHADDQAETLLARLNRASGVAGLAGVRPRGPIPGAPDDCKAPLLRPVLEWRRGELADVVAAAGIAAVQDPSNNDPRFDRARLRQALAQADWIDPAALAQSAAHLADADLALEWAARREFHECVERDGIGMTYRPRAPRAIALRVIARIVRELDGSEPRGATLARLFESLVRREPVSIGNLVARALPGGWCFTPAPKRRAAPPVKAPS